MKSPRSELGYDPETLIFIRFTIFFLFIFITFVEATPQEELDSWINETKCNYEYEIEGNWHDKTRTKVIK